MQKNVAGQKWHVFAFAGAGHANEGDPITGDASNITANLRLDGGAANAVDDTNPEEEEDGYYTFDITQAECNADLLLMTPESSTLLVEVIGVPGAIYTTPASFNAGAIALASAISALNDISIAQVNTEVDTALSDYDGPTDAEMIARTLAAADYFDPAADAVATVTTLTNLPSITTNWLTAAGINAAALNGKGNWNIGKTGYALSVADWNVGKTGYSLSVAPLTAAQVNAEMDTALVDIHLDHLLAVNYDPASKPGSATALLNELIENNGGVSRYTAASLIQAPTGGSAPTVGQIADQVWEEAQADHGSAGTFGIIAAEIAAIPTTAMRGTDGANTVVPPTVAQMNARTIVSANYATSAALATAQNDLDDIQTRLPAALADYGMVQKNTAFPNFPFIMVLSSDDITPATGLTVTAQRSIDGAAFEAVSGTISELSNGAYSFDAVAADTNGDRIMWRFLAATANDAWFPFSTVE